MGIISDAMQKAGEFTNAIGQKMGTVAGAIKDAKRQSDDEERKRFLSTPNQETAQEKTERKQKELAEKETRDTAQKKRAKDDDEGKQRPKEPALQSSAEMQREASARLARVQAELRKPLKDRDMSLFEPSDKEE